MTIKEFLDPGTSVTPTPFLSEEEEETPPRTPEERIVLKRAMASFDNLVALANHQETLKEARKIVWRDKGEPVVELDTVKQCLEHAGLGGVRSATLAFGIRASLNLVLALLGIHRVPRDFRLAVIRRALFGEDSFRSAAMMGTFTAVYKFLINVLPLLIPSLRVHANRNESAVEDEDEEEKKAVRKRTVVDVPLDRRSARLSLTRRAQDVLVRKRTRSWHAALAGAIAGGLAILWEKRNRRGVLAQQMFVRGLQGSYNAYSTKKGWHVLHGDVIVFSLACGQILYGYLMRPDTLPRSYSAWISKASKVPPDCIKINHDMTRTGAFNLDNLDAILRRPDVTPSNRSALLEFRNTFLTPKIAAPGQPEPYWPRYAPCGTIHPAVSDCSYVPIDRFFEVAKWMLPIYSVLHYAPAIVFKFNTFKKDPGSVLIKAGLGSLRSSAFLGVFVIIFQTLYCYTHKLHRALTMLRTGHFNGSIWASTPLARLPQSVIDLLAHKSVCWLFGLLSGLSLFVEAKRRRAELAMYVLPKGLESAWLVARGKGLVFKTGRWGEAVLTSLAMGLVMGTYQNNPQHLSGLVRRVLYQFIGPN